MTFNLMTNIEHPTNIEHAIKKTAKCGSIHIKHVFANLKLPS